MLPPRKEQAMHANINSILGFCEAMEADMASLREENANLWEVIKSQFVSKRGNVERW